MKISVGSIVVVTSACLVACGPSADDESMMNTKMELENARTGIIVKNANDCAKMGSELKAFHDKNADQLKSIDDKWVALSKGTKDKLIEKHKADWDKQSEAILLGASQCPTEFKAGYK